VIASTSALVSPVTSCPARARIVAPGPPGHHQTGLGEQFAQHGACSGVDGELKPQADPVFSAIPAAAQEDKPTLIGQNLIKFDFRDRLVLGSVHGRTSGWA
jgi:hypothetical protein